MKMEGGETGIGGIGGTPTRDALQWYARPEQLQVAKASIRTASADKHVNICQMYGLTYILHNALTVIAVEHTCNLQITYMF